MRSVSINRIALFQAAECLAHAHYTLDIFVLPTCLLYAPAPFAM